MIVNFYIECEPDLGENEFARLVKLEKLLRSNGFAFYNATDFDSCTSGPNSLKTLEDIEIQVEGK